MARIRYIKPELPMNEDLADLGHTAMLLFAMLPMLTDREGRLEDRPRRIKAQLFPYDNTQVESHLDKLVEAGFVRRYEVGGESYIEIVNWSRDQKIHHTEKESMIPEPPSIQQVTEKTVNSPLTNGETVQKSSPSRSPSHSPSSPPSQTLPSSSPLLLPHLTPSQKRRSQRVRARPPILPRHAVQFSTTGTPTMRSPGTRASPRRCDPASGLA